MIVVADTSPLNYLVRLGHAQILHWMFGAIIVPPAVFEEMQHPDAPAEVRAWAASPPPWIEQSKAVTIDVTLPVALGPGEREAISLAAEVKADLLLLDDLAAREEARARHIPLAGTLAVLLQGSLRGYLTFPLELDRLRELHFRFSSAVEAEMLARYLNDRSK